MNKIAHGMLSIAALASRHRPLDGGRRPVS
jgi:hypothetical protein